MSNLIDSILYHVGTKPKLSVLLQTSNISGQHKRYTIRSMYKYLLPRYFKSYALSRSGRSSFGNITVHSKSSFKHSKHFNKCFSLSGMIYFFYTAWFVKEPKSKKTLILSFNESGGLFLLPLTSHMLINSISPSERLNVVSRLFHQVGFLRNSVWSQISYIQSQVRFCYVSPSINEKVKFAKASGTSCLTVSHKTINGIVYSFIELPSGKVKVVYGETNALLGYILPEKAKDLINTKAGFSRNFGKKPKVRGVVKNPIDHPHGGRVRTVWKPRSPWGKYTK